jgi:hypothetical protein
MPNNSYTQDYWGLSARNCLDWIAKNDQKKHIKIASFTESAELNSLLIDKETRSRFEFTKMDTTADYEIQIRRDKYFGVAKGNEVFTICPMRDTIARVIKLKQ